MRLDGLAAQNGIRSESSGSSSKRSAIKVPPLGNGISDLGVGAFLTFASGGGRGSHINS